MRCPRIGDTKQDEDDDNSRDDAEREGGAIGLRIEHEEQRSDEGTKDGAGMVHRAVKAIDASAKVRRREMREHRVARRASEALPYAVDEAKAEHVRPRRDKRDQGPDGA